MTEQDESSGALPYKVGYGRPPKASQFQKGKSGNPRGRQKGVRNFHTDLKLSLEMPVKLNESGKPKRVSTQEALILRLREKALKGDRRALETYIALAKTVVRDAQAEGSYDLSRLSLEELHELEGLLEKATPIK
jgi:hypothetical protein